MSSCCSSSSAPKQNTPKKIYQKFDLILWGSIAVILLFYLQDFFLPQFSTVFSASIFELLNQMWWGVGIGIITVGLIHKVPKEFVMSLLGKGGTINGVLRATGAGVLLDLCSHGILMVGMKLYERGASLGQVMAFLIASPWNSFSLTLILWSLIGFWWMITFLLLSMLIAVISGVIFEKLTEKNILPHNPHTEEIPKEFEFFTEVKKQFSQARFTKKTLGDIFLDGFAGSKMVIKWVFFGVILASLIRTFVEPEIFSQFFGPTLLGLSLTLVAATIIEVCSEGSTPIASDLVTRGAAPGNGFAFLMTGAATDYTEIMSLKETTKSWKISFFLPLVTLPQVILLAWILNQV